MTYDKSKSMKERWATARKVAKEFNVPLRTAFRKGATFSKSVKMRFYWDQVKTRQRHEYKGIKTIKKHRKQIMKERKGIWNYDLLREVRENYLNAFPVYQLEAKVIFVSAPNTVYTGYSMIKKEQNYGEQLEEAIGHAQYQLGESSEVLKVVSLRWIIYVPGEKMEA